MGNVPCIFISDGTYLLHTATSCCELSMRCKASDKPAVTIPSMHKSFETFPF